MKRTSYVVVICIFLFSAIVYADFESDVIDLVNAERLSQGLHPLAYDANLAEAARGHSEDMGTQDYFSHTSLDNRTPADRVNATGYSWSYLGENIACGQATPQAVMNSWMASSGHRNNILNANYCDIGVGYAFIPGASCNPYWTQNFGRKKGVDACPDSITYTITATAGSGGSISPAGDVGVAQGGSLTFVFIPDPDFSVEEIVVDGVPETITASYTFEDVRSDHTIDVSFGVNQSAPIADAGSDQSVVEGHTVTLDGSQSLDPNDAVAVYEWTQLSGPTVWLSDENAAKPTFVAPPITQQSTITLELTVFDTGGYSDSDTVEINITDNGIQGLPDDVTTFYTATGRVMGIKTDSQSGLASLHTIDPESNAISDRKGMPQNLMYGLMDFKIVVDSPGRSSTVTFFLLEPMPEGYTWYKYTRRLGWKDYSAFVSFNDARDQLSLTLVDGGTGDDDEEQNSIIEDPSGPGIAPATSAGSTISSSGGGGGGGGGSGSGGCFIDTLTNGIF